MFGGSTPITTKSRWPSVSRWRAADGRRPRRSIRRRRARRSARRPPGPSAGRHGVSARLGMVPQTAPLPRSRRPWPADGPHERTVERRDEEQPVAGLIGLGGHAAHSSAIEGVAEDDAQNLWRQQADGHGAPRARARATEWDGSPGRRRPRGSWPRSWLEALRAVESEGNRGSSRRRLPAPRPRTGPAAGRRRNRGPREPFPEAPLARRRRGAFVARDGRGGPSVPVARPSAAAAVGGESRPDHLAILHGYRPGLDGLVLRSSRCPHAIHATDGCQTCAAAGERSADCRLAGAAGGTRRAARGPDARQAHPRNRVRRSDERVLGRRLPAEAVQPPQPRSRPARHVASRSPALSRRRVVIAARMANRSRLPRPLSGRLSPSIPGTNLLRRARRYSCRRRLSREIGLPKPEPPPFRAHPFRRPAHPPLIEDGNRPIACRLRALSTRQAPTASAASRDARVGVKPRPVVLPVGRRRAGQTRGGNQGGSVGREDLGGRAVGDDLALAHDDDPPEVFGRRTPCRG